MMNPVSNGHRIRKRMEEEWETTFGGRKRIQQKVQKAVGKLWAQEKAQARAVMATGSREALGLESAHPPPCRQSPADDSV